MSYNLSLNVKNAPRGLRTCPNCRLVEKAIGFDGAGGDFWWCLAKPVMPEFCGVFYGGMKGQHTGMPINLALFDPASTYADRLNSRECPLFEAKP